MCHASCSLPVQMPANIPRAIYCVLWLLFIILETHTNRCHFYCSIMHLANCTVIKTRIWVLPCCTITPTLTHHCPPKPHVAPFLSFLRNRSTQSINKSLNMITGIKIYSRLSPGGTNTALIWRVLKSFLTYFIYAFIICCFIIY